MTAAGEPDDPRVGPVGRALAEGRPVRVFISYAHDDTEHEGAVQRFWVFLRESGIDARLDAPAAQRPQDWATWMHRQVRAADVVLVVVSPAYKRRAEGDAEPGEGSGVQWEARLIRDEVYADHEAALLRFLPVVLPGRSKGEIPSWLGPNSHTCYTVSAFTVDGAEPLVRYLTGQAAITSPALGQVPVLPGPLATGPATPAVADKARPVAGGTREVLRTEVRIEASLDAGDLACSVSVAGTEFSSTRKPLPHDVGRAWTGRDAGSLVAAERMTTAGAALASVVFDEMSGPLVGDLADRLAVDAWLDVVLVAGGAALALPIELVRLTTSSGVDLGPVALRPGVTVRREVSGAGGGAPVAALPGPVRVLAAVAAPEETSTDNAPLDVEAEMQAVLDAVTPVSGGGGDGAGQVRILEVASLDQVRTALAENAFHVLHLSAHGSPSVIELETEDGAAAPVSTDDLVAVLRDAGAGVPLVLLSSCSGAGHGAEAMAAGLVTRGIDRVIAMQAPVTDTYATTLAAALYGQLVDDPGQPVPQALARARRAAEKHLEKGRLPEYAVATLLTRPGADAPLVDTAAAPAPLRVAAVTPAEISVRALPLGRLIGRRRELRVAGAALRRAETVVGEHAAIAGVQLVGIGGIGKSALAGRLMGRLTEEGWAVAVHEGAWRPDTLVAAVAAALPDQQQRLAGLAEEARVMAVADLLAAHRLLLVFDDFEQNLSPGGGAFLDPTFETVLTDLTDAATIGAVLVTCRYPVPGEDRGLVRVDVPPLSRAELGRLFLRLPALAGLDAEDRRLLARVIGGHPRLIEFVAALYSGKRAPQPETRAKLRDLAKAQGVDVTRPRPLHQAVDEALILGAANVFLDELVGLLTDTQRAALDLLSLCRAPMDVDDLAVALTGQDPPTPDDVTRVRGDVEALQDLTLLVPGEEVLAHPWTATLHAESLSQEHTRSLHQAAQALRLRRFQTRKARYADLVDLPRHLAALGAYDDVVAVAGQAVQVLDGALASAAYLAEIRPLVPATERAWLLVAELELQSVLASGDLVAVRRLMGAFHGQAEERASADPTNTGWQRDLSISHNKLGDLAVAAGDLTAARTAYQAALDIAVRLAAADPTNTGWQRDLSISHNKLGDLAVAAGDLTAARTAYQAALDIRLRLAAADPTNTGWQRDLSVSHNKLGDLAVAAGDLTAARTAYQAALDIAARLAAADPTNTGWQRDLSVSHNKLGDLAVAAGDLTAARTAYQAALDIAARLAAADPTNTGWQRDLSVSHNKLGDLAVAAGDLTAARTAYQADLDIAARLAAADPTNTGWQRDLSISHNKLGDLAVAAGDLTAARTAYQAALDIRLRLAAADPTNTGWQRDLSISHNKLGDLAVAAGDLTAARTAYQAALDIAVRLAAADPTNTGWQRDLSISHNKLGDLAVAAGDLTAARTAYQAALDIAARLAAADPTNTQWQRDLTVICQKLDELDGGTTDSDAS